MSVSMRYHLPFYSCPIFFLEDMVERDDGDDEVPMTLDGLFCCSKGIYLAVRISRMISSTSSSKTRTHASQPASFEYEITRLQQLYTLLAEARGSTISFNCISIWRTLTALRHLQSFLFSIIGRVRYEFKPVYLRGLGLYKNNF